MEGLLLLPVVLGGQALRYARDLGSSVASLFGGGLDLEEIGDLHTRQAALSQIITLAVLADGEVTDIEAENLRHLFATSDQFTGDAESAIEHLRGVAQRASEIEALENTVRVVASDLDREWKDDAFSFVAVLALRGSGFGQHQQGFRVAPTSDPDTLLGIFAKALDVSPEHRDSAIRAASLVPS